MFKLLEVLLKSKLHKVEKQQLYVCIRDANEFAKVLVKNLNANCTYNNIMRVCKRVKQF